MSGAEVLDVGRDAIWLTIQLCAPVLVVGLVVGVGIGLFQALTQIQEQTLIYAPKIIAIFVSLLLFLPLMGALLGGFMFALTNVTLRRLHTVPGPARMVTMFGGCMLMALAVACIGLQVGVVEPFPAANSTWIVTGLLLAGVLMLGNWALQFGAARLAAGTTALVMLSEVMFASVSSALLGAATLNTRTVLGGALILLALVLGLGLALLLNRPFRGQKIVQTVLIVVFIDPTRPVVPASSWAFAVGAIVQLMSLGVAAMGGASVPDYPTAAIIGAVVAITSGQEASVGVAAGIAMRLRMSDFMRAMSPSNFSQFIIDTPNT